MQKRVNIRQTEPQAYNAMFAIEKYLQSTRLNPNYRGLIKIRASQINGCAFCIDLHTKEARQSGETEQRIYMLNAWKESALFSEEEKSILALTEEITLIQKGLSEDTYRKAASLFDENYLAQLIMEIVTINAWNRISISTLLQPS